MDDLKELREELARLRERVAVLEARPQVAPDVWPNKFTLRYPGWLPAAICCEAKGA